MRRALDGDVGVQASATHPEGHRALRDEGADAPEPRSPSSVCPTVDALEPRSPCTFPTDDACRPGVAAGAWAKEGPSPARLRTGCWRAGRSRPGCPAPSRPRRRRVVEADAGAPDDDEQVRARRQHVLSDLACRADDERRAFYAIDELRGLRQSGTRPPGGRLREGRRSRHRDPLGHKNTWATTPLSTGSTPRLEQRHYLSRRRTGDPAEPRVEGRRLPETAHEQ